MYTNKNQTKALSILYPDGKMGPRPYDTEKFIHEGYIYRFDDLLNKWVDEKGEIFNPDPYQLPLGYSTSKYNQTNTSSKSNGCVCGCWMYGEAAKHSSYCPKS